MKIFSRPPDLMFAKNKKPHFFHQKTPILEPNISTHIRRNTKVLKNGCLIYLKGCTRLKLNTSLITNFDFAIT
jgi:hypothetical protein